MFTIEEAPAVKAGDMLNVPYPFSGTFSLIGNSVVVRWMGRPFAHGEIIGSDGSIATVKITKLAEAE